MRSRPPESFVVWHMIFWAQQTNVFPFVSSIWLRLLLLVKFYSLFLWFFSFFLFCCWCSIESEKVEQVKWSKVKQFHSKIEGGTQWIKVGKNKEYNRGEKKYPNEKGKQWVSDEFFCVLSRKYMKWVMEWHTFLLTSRIMFHISCVHFSF